MKLLLKTGVTSAAPQKPATRPAPKPQDVTIAVVFAIRTEWTMACLLFADKADDLYKESGEHLTYQLCRIPSIHGGENVVALSLLTDFGTTVAAAHATHVCASFPKLKYLMMCGIAGAIPDPSAHGGEADIRLGDIVYVGPTGVIQHDHIKDIVSAAGGTPEYKKQYRGRQGKPNKRLGNTAQQLQSADPEAEWPWVARMKSLSPTVQKQFIRPPAKSDKLHQPPLVPGELGAVIKRKKRAKGRTTHPHVFSGGIASGNHLMKNPSYRDQLAKDNPAHEFRCVEMEGAGIAEAAELYGKGFFIVRGISDYCDAQKTKEWQPYAASAAAAFTWCIINNLPDLLLEVDGDESVGEDPQAALSAAATSEAPVDSKQTTDAAAALSAVAAGTQAQQPLPIEAKQPAAAVSAPAEEPALPPSPGGFIREVLDRMTLAFRTMEMETYLAESRSLETFLEDNAARIDRDLLALALHEIANAYLRLMPIQGFNEVEMTTGFDRVRSQLETLANE